MTGFLMVFALHSDGRYDNEFLSNYAYINLLQNQLLKINGVGKVSIMGAGEYAMRIWVKPDLLNYYNVSLDELRSAVLAEGGIYPAGQFGAEPSPEGTTYTYTVTMPRQISTAEEFAAIVVKTTPPPASRSFCATWPTWRWAASPTASLRPSAKSRPRCWSSIRSRAAMPWT